MRKIKLGINWGGTANDGPASKFISIGCKISSWKVGREGRKKERRKKKKKKKKGYFVERVPSLHGDVSSENNVTR